MKNKDKILKLSEEARNLIIEFREESSVLGENLLKSIEVSEDGLIFTIDNVYDGVEEHELTHISSVFELEMDGWAMCSPSFYECLDIIKGELKCKYNKKSKDEFINYVGQLHYAEYRCEEIYKRLQVIEDEALELLK